MDLAAEFIVLGQASTVEATKLGGAMSAPVRYIDRTRDYYLGQGYDKPYEWAHHVDAPFTPLSKPLSECRVAIVSTSDIAIKKPDGSRDRDNEFSVGNVYSLPSDTPVDLLYSRQEHYDQHATSLDDVNAYYPVSRLGELVDRGEQGFARDDVDVDPGSLVVPVLVLERGLGAVFLGHAVLLGCETLA